MPCSQDQRNLGLPEEVVAALVCSRVSIVMLPCSCDPMVLVENTGLGYNIRVYGSIVLTSLRGIHSVRCVKSDMETVPYAYNSDGVWDHQSYPPDQDIQQAG